jgi:hypothetical protein
VSNDARRGFELRETNGASLAIEFESHRALPFGQSMGTIYSHSLPSVARGNPTVPAVCKPPLGEFDELDTQQHVAIVPE